MSAAIAGDQAAYSALFDRYFPRLYRFALVRTGSPEVAEELAAGSLTRAFRTLGGYEWRSGETLTPWLFQITRNAVADHRRHSRPEAVELDDQLVWDGGLAQPDAFADRMAAVDELRAALRQLTPDQRQVVLLRFADDLKVKDVARVLDKTEGAVQALQYRALQSLHALLAERSLR